MSDEARDAYLGEQLRKIVESMHRHDSLEISKSGLYYYKVHYVPGNTDRSGLGTGIPTLEGVIEFLNEYLSEIRP